MSDQSEIIITEQTPVMPAPDSTLPVAVTTEVPTETPPVEEAQEGAEAAIEPEVVAEMQGAGGSTTAQPTELEQQLQQGDAVMYGALLAAKSPYEFAAALRAHGRQGDLLFEFEGQTFIAPAGIQGKPEPPPYLIFTAVIRLKLTRQNPEDPRRPEHTYQLDIYCKSGKVKSIVVSARELYAMMEARVMFLERGNERYGPRNPIHHERFMDRLLRHREKTVVRLMKFIGTDLATNAYVTSKYAVYDDVLLRPENGSFKIGDEYIEPFFEPGERTLEPEPGAELEAYRMLVAPFGDRARIALAWYVASMLRHEMFAANHYIAILSLYGDHNTGKTTLVRRLQCLSGYAFEGLNLRKGAMTPIGFQRTLARRSGVPVHVSEYAHSEAERVLPISAVLTLYDGSDLNVSGQKTNDNRTRIAENHTTLVFAQNVEPFRTPQERSRVLSLEFLKDENANTIAAYEALLTFPQARIAGLGVMILQRRREIFAAFQKVYPDMLARMREVLPKTEGRIIELHAQVAAMFTAVNEVLKLGEPDLMPVLIEIAKRKVESCTSAVDDTVENFWDGLTKLLENDGTHTFGKGDTAETVELAAWHDVSSARLWDKVRRAGVETGATVLALDMTRFKTSDIGRASIDRDIRSRLKDLGVYVGTAKVHMNGKTQDCWILRGDMLDRHGINQQIGEPGSPQQRMPPDKDDDDAF